ncbi:hypothetical protein [Parendozoicomonas haliclonae]|uniref:Uncharacterized protein n=1 Tax=Parendozoicomonas haliclonae TaxID=1960125 RepID=A0A1X7AIG2_9GAMM|nr:hypothetical protein [Parendozoicomonas haliclonae]SMA45138.1 hypothetical protein EHSB41UT_01853 [Parendozoicomonas haliclonae]
MNKEIITQLNKTSQGLHEQAYAAAGLSKLLLNELLGEYNGLNTRLDEEERTHLATALHLLTTSMEETADGVVDTLTDESVLGGG